MKFHFAPSGVEPSSYSIYARQVDRNKHWRIGKVSRYWFDVLKRHFNSNPEWS